MILTLRISFVDERMIGRVHPLTTSAKALLSPTLPMKKIIFIRQDEICRKMKKDTDSTAPDAQT